MFLETKDQHIQFGRMEEVRKEVREGGSIEMLPFLKVVVFAPNVKAIFCMCKNCNFYNIFSASFLHEFIFAYIYTYRVMILKR